MALELITAATGAPAAAAAPAIEIADLRFVYPARRGQAACEAIKGISLRLAAGGSAALLGPNGSGKSTLMRIICGMMRPTSGRLIVGGESDPAAFRPLLSVVFQSNGLDPHLTVEENLLCQAGLYGLRGRDARRRIDEELERGDLGDRRASLVKTLSGGLKRRVDLARAMLHHPRILLLDEPTVGLDPAARQMFLDSIDRRQREAGMTVVMSTHLIDEADRCDRAVFVHGGRIVADGAPADLRHGLGGAFVTVHSPGRPTLNLDVPWKAVGSQWVAPIGQSQREQAALELARRGIAFTIAPPTLADVFVELTGEALNDQPEAASGSEGAGGHG